MPVIQFCHFFMTTCSLNYYVCSQIVMPIYTCIILCTLPIHQLITFQSINLLSHFFFLTSSLKPVLFKSSIYVTTIKTNNYLMSTSSRQPISYNSYVYPHIVMLICIHVPQYIHFFTFFSSASLFSLIFLC